jgi:hypothetical protein
MLDVEFLNELEAPQVRFTADRADRAPKETPVFAGHPIDQQPEDACRAPHRPEQAKRQARSEHPAKLNRKALSKAWKRIDHYQPFDHLRITQRKAQRNCPAEGFANYGRLLLSEITDYTGKVVSEILISEPAVVA